jgi:asparagine synthase (glutamine-hydrolysing)
LCGISAIVSTRGHDVQRLLRMHAPIRHRGPDGEGFLGVTRAGEIVRSTAADSFEALAHGREIVFSLAFRWLKIQDVNENARQPMATPDEALWIALNGEIYNFRELRAELESHGHTFATHSDTEVALAAYARWGTDCFARFNGMWAIVFLDLRARKVVVSRDRAGIKPLFWSKDGDALLLASEAKQIGGAPDADSIARFVASERLAQGHTYFEDVSTFPAASFAELELGGDIGIRARSYWDLAAVASARHEITYDEAVEQVDGVLRSAIDMQLLADVGVGTLLSGGLDSSLVTAMTARFSAPRPAFSFVLESPEDRRLDESPYIDEVARASAVPLHKTTMDAAWVRENFARVTRAQEAPVTGLPVVAQFRTHELAASRGVRVVLDGQGADEIFAGYQRHQAIYLNDLLRSAKPLAFARELAAFTRRNRRYPLLYVRQGLLAPVRGLVDPPHARGPSWFRAKPARDSYAKLRGVSLLQRGLYEDVTRVNIPTVLGITDRNSMAHSLEARVPLLDHRLIELAFRLPPSFKVGEGMRKRVLRTIARRYVPDRIIDRTDSLGFGTPQVRWMRGELAADIRDAQHDEVFRRYPWFDAEGIARETDPRRLWMIYALRTFLRSSV